MYQQLLPTKLYHHNKTGTNPSSDVLCSGMFGSGPESVPNILAGCSTLAKTKGIARHNAALKELFFELLKDRNLITEIPPWYSPVQPKPMYENEQAKAFWDVAVYAENTELRTNRIDARVIDKQRKRVLAVEMSCPWMDNRPRKTKRRLPSTLLCDGSLSNSIPHMR